MRSFSNKLLTVRQNPHGLETNRRTWKWVSSLGLLVGLLLPHFPLQADLYYEQVSSLKPVGAEGQAPSTMKSKVYVRHRMVRAEDVNAKKVIIVRLDKGIIWGLNQNDKTFTELTIKQLENDWQRARRSAGVTEDPKLSVTVQEDGEEVVNGYNCRKFTLLADGQPVMHLWNTTALDVPEKDDLYDYKQILGAFPKALIDKARSLPGFPLRVKAVENIGAGKVETFREIVTVRMEPLDPSLFELPEGFKKVEVEVKP